MMQLADVGAFETYETCRYELLDLLSQVDHVLCLKRCSELCNTIDWKFCLGKVASVKLVTRRGIIMVLRGTDACSWHL